MHASGPSLFGRIGVGVAVLGAMLGTMLGDPEASRQAEETRPPIVQTVQPEVSYVGDAVRRASRALAPFGLDAPELLSSLGYVTFSVQLDRAHLLNGGSSSGLAVEPGTRITTELHRRAVSLSARPSLGWRVDWAPDAEIQRLAYDFERGQFRVDASGLGPDFIYEDIITDKTNQHLRRRLPWAMQQPGYDPWSDREIERNVQALVDLLRRSSGGAEEASGLGVDHLSSPSITLSFRVPETKTIPLEGGRLSARLEEGTTIDLSASFTGPVSQPRLQSLVLHFHRPLEVAQGTGERRSSVRKIDVHRATLTPGGQIELDYELGAEQLADGVKAVFALFALMAAPRANVGGLRQTRLEFARRDVQQRIDTEIEPQLIEVIRQNDGALPGLSLSDVFGVGASSPSVPGSE